MAAKDKEHAVRIASLSLTAKIYEGLADSYRFAQQIDSSYHYLKLSASLHQQIDKINYESRLQSLKAKLAFDEAQQSLKSARLEAGEQKRNRNYGIGSAILLGGLLALLYRQKFKQQQLLRQLDLMEREAAEAEMKRARITIDRIKAEIQESRKKLQDYQQQEHLLGSLDELKASAFLTEDSWQSFRYDFIKAYPQFFERLAVHLPRISAQMERICTLIFLQFTDGEIADVLGISEQSVGRSKRRIRQAMDLPSNVRLEDIIRALQSPAAGN